MDPTCKMALGYRSLSEVDPAAAMHIRNCQDCQGEVYLLEELPVAG